MRSIINVHDRRIQNRNTARFSQPRTRGVSLIEVMIGMAIFSLLALGIIATAMHSLRTSQLNVMKNTAFTVSQGFLEQIRSIDESHLKAAVEDPYDTPIPTKSVSATSAGGVIHVDSPLYLEDPVATADGQNHRKILVDLTENSAGEMNEVFMDMWFDLDITPMTTANGYLIKIDFKYYRPGLNYLAAQTGSVRIVRGTGSEN